MTRYSEKLRVCVLCALCIVMVGAYAAEPGKKAFDMTSLSWKGFIACWRKAAANERGASQAFIGALCRLILVLE